MVDVDTIQDRLKQYFSVWGTTHINPETGIVDVDGRVELIEPISQLPVQFGKVTGGFLCNEKRLESLVGAPRTVGEQFSCRGNRLTSLEGGPKWVGGNYGCSNNQLMSLVGAPVHVGTSFQVDENPLQSLEGMPEHIGKEIWLLYDPHLPLLRLLTVKRCILSYGPVSVKEILKKYQGQGKPGAIRAAAELAKAGFKGNAKW